MKNTKIAIIGCGNLGSSIAHGLIADGRVPASSITATRRNPEALADLAASGVRVLKDNIQAVRDAELILVALKPYNILEVLQEVKSHFDPEKHILVSLATGVSLGQIKDVVGKDIPTFRAMPNTAADVGVSMTCISTDGINSEAAEIVISCFQSIGEAIIIDESLMDSATVLGACGVAYVLRFIRGMIQGGIEIGFDARTASAIVTQTVKGAAELLIQRGEHPEFEIDKVTTPRGCTIAGLNEMEHNGFSSALIKGIVTSFDKIPK